MSGGFPPGMKLTIRDLAAQMGISPTPIREALQQLSAEGALTQVAGRSFKVPDLNPDNYQDLRSLRVLIEGEGAFRAAANATTPLIDALQDIHARLITAKTAGKFRDALAWNQRFHMTLCQAAGSPRLSRIVEGLWLQMGPILNVLYGQTDTPPIDAQHCHLMVIDALITRNGAQARRAIQNDINGNAETILTNLRTHGRDEM